MHIQYAYIVLQYAVLGVIFTSKENNIGLQIKSLNTSKERDYTYDARQGSNTGNS